MSETRRFLPLSILVAVVTLAAGVMGALFGGLALGLYGGGELGVVRHGVHAPIILGPILGGAGGLLAGALWGIAMLRLTVSWRRRPKLPFVRVLAAGTALGVVAGIASTVALHAGLQIAVGQASLDGHLVGLLFGVPVGLLLGLVSSGIWVAVLASLRRRLAGAE